MNSIDFPTLITTIFVLVDDWYQQTILPLLLAKPGAKERLSDSELLTLAKISGLLTLSRTDPVSGFYPSQLSTVVPPSVRPEPI
ncbi:hypothetical protein BJP36_28250 [Moorena producens JHB]|uniref:Uncharacterized protein n=1 Tax=Moorena producens (strain JHB) TaxID=1454205 RepID=A0A1D9G6S5_MOOP1|nr:hypothetical protein [Moorena producens]AOY83234.2 hypothetical protein BJP36_28250 [Moorena producens JHB]